MDMSVFLLLMAILAKVCMGKYPCDELFTNDTHETENPADEEITLTEEELTKLAENFTEYNLNSECGLHIKTDPFSPNKTEGDMAGNIKEARNLLINSLLARSAITGNWRLWSNGRIPFALSKHYGAYSKGLIAKEIIHKSFHQISVQEALKEVESKTCVKFVPKATSDHNYVSIFKGDGCYSMVGRTGGAQQLSLSKNCLDKGTIIHEIMHALGFFHEQSRNDRDEFVEILWGNIQFGQTSQFHKYSVFEIRNQKIGYDYASIMHYGRRAFSHNGLDTIRPRSGKPGGHLIGQRRGMSDKDILKVNKLYNCPMSTPAPKRPTTAPPCEDSKTGCKYFKRWLGICKRDHVTNDVINIKSVIIV